MGGKTFLVFDETPFYAECGGQVSDKGTIEIEGDVFTVSSVQRDKNGCCLHGINDNGKTVMPGQEALLSVDKCVRRNTARNHSATHLLQSALRMVLGNHVKQAGSFVDSYRLRFDFNAFSAPTEAELNAVERIVEGEILACVPSNIFEVPVDEIPRGCIANFGEKYGEIVRVVEFGEFSRELCGGCHVDNAVEIACFKIVSSSAIAAGVRRIEAVTAGAAFDLFRANCAIVGKQCESFSCQPSEILEKTSSLVVRCREFEKSVKAARQATLRGMAAEIATSAAVKDGNLVRVDMAVGDLQADELRSLALDVLARVGEGTVTLTSQSSQRGTVVACCSTGAIAAGNHAGNIVKEIVGRRGGSGGGRPELAMGGYSVQP
jgi:alanyl-tRNA synthetase